MMKRAMMKRVVPGLFIEATEIDIKTDCHEVPRGGGIQGGVICTGFLDIEKILRHVIFRKGRLETIRFFLEKKLPFQVVLLAFDKDHQDHGGSDEHDAASDDVSGSFSGSDEHYR